MVTGTAGLPPAGRFVEFSAVPGAFPLARGGSACPVVVDPNDYPGETVASSLRHFERELAGLETQLVPWLQEFSLGREYAITDVQAQITAALAANTAGFLLWNPAGVYTARALTYDPSAS